MVPSWNLILRGLTDVFIHVTYIALPFVPFYVLTLGVWDGVRLFGPQALHRWATPTLAYPGAEECLVVTRST